MLFVIEKLASIIVPVYNVEQYLERCLQSLVNQTYANIEIILVDDGSTDKCPEICERWAVNDRRIKVIHKQNAGLGYARNTGIDYAVGEYLFFIDSDDYIALDTVEKIMKIAERTNAEIIQFGSFDVDKNNIIKSRNIPNMKNEIYRGKEILDIILPNMIATDLQGTKMHLPLNACSKAFSHSLILRTGWRFVSERKFISEDHYSLLCLMNDVQSFAIISEAFYYYCENQNSLSRTFRSDRYEQYKKLYNACKEKCDELGYNQKVKDRLAYLHMNYVIWVLHGYIVSNLSIKNKKLALNKIINDNDLQLIIRQIDIKKEKFTKRLLYFAIKQRWTNAIYLLLQIRYGRGK